MWCLDSAIRKLKNTNVASLLGTVGTSRDEKVICLNLKKQQGSACVGSLSSDYVLYLV